MRACLQVTSYSIMSQLALVFLQRAIHSTVVLRIVHFAISKSGKFRFRCSCFTMPTEGAIVTDQNVNNLISMLSEKNSCVRVIATGL